MKKLYSIIIAIALLFSITACNSSTNSSNNTEKPKTEKSSKSINTESLSQNIKVSENVNESLQNIELSGNENIAITGFGIEVLKNCVFENEDENKNVLISPLSIMYALSMTENGADGETLKQMEDVLGIKIDVANKYFYNYKKSLEKDEKQKMLLANSIWLKDDGKINVNKNFLQKNKDFYDAEVFKAKFDDSTLNDINMWVSNNTDKMIEKVIENISKENFMYLINAITFKDNWAEKYSKRDVHDDTFTLENGDKEDIKMLNSSEYTFLENENSTGVVKFYKDRKYAFVAMLPNENIKMKDYINSLSGDEIHKIMENSKDVEVITAIPEFKSEYGTSLKENLIKLGIKDAFNPKLADFGTMVNNDDKFRVFISSVIHKTFIEVDKQGTKAAAATAVVMAGEACAPVEEKEIKEVILNRPFMYMIYDVENELPVFMGVTMKIN